MVSHALTSAPDRRIRALPAEVNADTAVANDFRRDETTADPPTTRPGNGSAEPPFNDILRPIRHNTTSQADSMSENKLDLWLKLFRFSACLDYPAMHK